MTSRYPSGNLATEALDLDSDFEEEDEEVRERKERKRKLQDLKGNGSKRPDGKKAKTEQFNTEVTDDEGRRQRYHLLSLTAYDRHKKLVNDYFLYHPGATEQLKRDTSRDKTDIDVIKENHKFLWDDQDDDQLDWGQKLAKKYYEKLFKEYCICDLSRYKENKVAMRWRIEKEVVTGKGQFSCGSRKCTETEMLRSWEVNFSYIEGDEKKNALVKVRLCPDCSYKLNYYHKKKEVTKKKKKRKDKKKKKKKTKKDDKSEEEEESEDEEEKKKKDNELEKKASDIWSAPAEVEQEKSREEDFSEYLEDLFL